MSSVNRVILVGHLGADPEMRYTQGGQAVCNLRVATSESWTDKDGNKQERTEWHGIAVWGKQAEFCGNYLSKGRQVYIEGSIEYSKSDDGKYWTNIVIGNPYDGSKMEFISGKGESAGAGSSAPQDDDIPF